MSKLPQDLSRFLFVVPWVARHPDGVPVEDVCGRLGMTPKELHRLLERVAMVGTPDGSPDELVDVYLEGDRVFVGLPQKFVRPPRFSVDEMLALLLVLAPLREAPVPQLAAEAEALSDRLVALSSTRAAGAAPSLQERMIVAADGGEEPAHLRDFERAVRERLVCDVEYYTAGRDAFGARQLRPVAMLQRRGAWYVIGDDTKTFKVERFRSVTLTDEPFELPEGIDLDAYRQGKLFVGGGPPREVTVLEVDGHEQRWHGASARTRTWVRRQRGRAVLKEPGEERQKLIDETRELLARYV